MKKLLFIILAVGLLATQVKKEKYYYIVREYNNVYVTDGNDSILIDCNIDQALADKLESQIGYKDITSAVYHYQNLK